MTARILLLVCLLVARVSAQPLSAVGQPLPDARLTGGTIVVRVVAGEITKPAEGVPVTITIDGTSKVVKTDTSGRAQVDGIAAKSRITVSLPSAAPELARSTFLMPDAGGIRLFLSTAKWKQAMALPTGREMSGRPRPDPDLAVGTLAVRLLYDDLNDPKPPSGIVVSLVGYAADGKVTVVTRPSDSKGIAQFTGLDSSERTAYFAFVLLPRNGAVDRLRSHPIMLDPSAGQRVILSSAGRAAKDPALDPEVTAVPKGKVRVRLTGASSTVEIVDAVSGKVLATAPPQGDEVVLALAAAPGQLIYAQTTHDGETYRSRPLPVIAERGASFVVIVAPRLQQRLTVLATVEDDRLLVYMHVELTNSSWRPTLGGHEVILPTGFQALELGDESYAKPTPRGIRLDGPLPPAARSLVVAFALPIVNQRVKVAMELLLPTAGTLKLKADPGVAFAELPAGTSARSADNSFLVEGIKATKVLNFTVTAPKPDPKQMAIRKACKDLAPNRDSPLAGKPLVDFTAPQLDGKPFTLSSLKGKLVFVTFNASWNGLRGDLKTLPALAKQLGAELVTVLSDSDPAEVTKAFGALSRAVLDRPVGDSSLGPITGRWNITAVPETYVIDRKGTIKFHVVNQRDWSVPSVLACLKTGI